MFGLFPLHFEISFKYLSLILKILVLQYMHAFYIYEGLLHHSSAFMIQRWSVSNCDWFGFVVLYGHILGHLLHIYSVTLWRPKCFEVMT
jgi:hypothetical protein